MDRYFLVICILGDAAEDKRTFEGGERVTRLCKGCNVILGYIFICILSSSRRSAESMGFFPLRLDFSLLYYYDIIIVMHIYTLGVRRI